MHHVWRAAGTGTDSVATPPRPTSIVPGPPWPEDVEAQSAEAHIEEAEARRPRWSFPPELGRGGYLPFFRFLTQRTLSLQTSPGAQHPAPMPKQQAESCGQPRNP